MQSAKELDDREKAEIGRRKTNLLWYLLRAPFYDRYFLYVCPLPFDNIETVIRPLALRFLAVLKRIVPFLAGIFGWYVLSDNAGSSFADSTATYMQLWQKIYTYNWA